VKGLCAHGYYGRWIVDEAGQVQKLPVRRFRCRACGRTVSYLPEFAQPYRLLGNVLIGAYVTGQTSTPALQSWRDRLCAYRRRFLGWWPTLRVHLGCAWGRPPPEESPQAAWRRLIEKGGGDLNTATRRLVTTWKLCWFGRYQCHQHAL
jgi:hypothetical protein